MSVPAAHSESGKRAGDQPLTINEVAVLLGVSKQTVYRLVHDQLLAAERVGRCYRVAPAALTEFLGVDCVHPSEPLLTWIDPTWTGPR